MNKFNKSTIHRFGRIDSHQVQLDEAITQKDIKDKIDNLKKERNIKQVVEPIKDIELVINYNLKYQNFIFSEDNLQEISLD